MIMHLRNKLHVWTFSAPGTSFVIHLNFIQTGRLDPEYEAKARVFYIGDSVSQERLWILESMNIEILLRPIWKPGFNSCCTFSIMFTSLSRQCHHNFYSVPGTVCLVIKLNVTETTDFSTTAVCWWCDFLAYKEKFIGLWIFRQKDMRIKFSSENTSS